nr:hypothetical protein [Tanacetum cinerariifolium]
LGGNDDEEICYADEVWLHLHNHSSLAATDGIIKHSEAIFKSEKVHRKPPQSFTMVIELLLESIITFAPPLEDKAVVGESSLVIDMEIDVASNKGKGKAIASASEEKEDTGQESFESLAKVVFILKLLKEILLMYGPSVHVLVRKDAKFSSSHGGGIFHHILGSFLPHLRNSKKEKNTDADWRHKLAEVNNAFSDFADNGKVKQSPGNDIQAFVDLLDDVLAARLRARLPIGSSISGEASATFIDVGLVLELVTKEHVHSRLMPPKLNQVKPSGHLKHRGAEYTGDDMEHDQDINGGYAPPSEDDRNHGLMAGEAPVNFLASQTHLANFAVLAISKIKALDTI